MKTSLIPQPSAAPPALQANGTASSAPPAFSLTATPVPATPATKLPATAAPVPAKEENKPAPPPDHAAIAKEVRDAGADVAKVKAALKKLNCNDPDIKIFKRVYLETYNTPVETYLKSKFKGDDLTAIAALLSHSGSTDTWGQTREASNKVTETISKAPEAYKAWNGKFSWTSKFQLYFNHDQGELVVRLRLCSKADAKTKAAWKKAVEEKWGGKFKLEVDKGGGSTKTYDIAMMVDWVDKPEDAHYDITANKKDATAGGRAGNGGTTSMTGWGTDDTVDITHEVGHMLGSVEDYFTTNGVDNTNGGKKKGFRDKGGGIMNNPSEDPLSKHYDTIRKEAAAALGVNESKCKIK
ncbi:MAG: hypothetical protein U0176_06840 [Bacteroidia bacterium]